MPTSTQEKAGPDAGQQTAIYVYGIVPGDVKLNSGVHGVGDPPGEVRLVRSGDLAALVSELDAIYAAFLIKNDQAGDFEQVVADLSDRWQGRVELTVRGPMAPYDFVGGTREAGG